MANVGLRCALWVSIDQKVSQNIPQSEINLVADFFPKCK